MDLGNTVLLIGSFVTIDTIGFMVKISTNEKFANYHLRKIPFLWLFFS